MKHALLLAAAAALVASAAHAQMGSQPGVSWTTNPVIGNCVTAVNGGIATTDTGCGGSTGGITGPGTTIANDIVLWGGTNGTSVIDSNIQIGNVGIKNLSNSWTGLNIFYSGSNGSGAYPALQMVAPDSSGALRGYPNLAATNFNPTVQTGDAALVFGMSLNAGQCFDLVPWSTTASGFQLCPSNLKFVMPTLFEASSVWNPNTYITVPSINLSGASSGPAGVNSIQIGGKLVLYSDGADTVVLPPASSGRLYLTNNGGLSGAGAYIETDGSLHANGGLLTNTPSSGDNSENVATTAFVQAALSGGASPSPATFTIQSAAGPGATITGTGTLGSGQFTLNTGTAAIEGEQLTITAPTTLTTAPFCQITPANTWAGGNSWWHITTAISSGTFTLTMYQDNGGFRDNTAFTWNYYCP